MRGGRWGRLTAVPPPDTGVNTTHYSSHVDRRRGTETLNETFPIEFSEIEDTIVLLIILKI